MKGKDGAKEFVDGWGYPLIYQEKLDSNKKLYIRLVSMGEDHRLGTKDDMEVIVKKPGAYRVR